MLLHNIQCPNCKSTLTSKAGVPAGQKLNCPKCKSPFVAGAPAEDFEVVDETEVVDDDFEVLDDEPAPKKRPAPAAKSAAKPSTRRPVDEDDEDEEDEAPRARRRSRDDDDDDEEDDDDRPRRKKGRKEKSGYAKVKENVAVRIITLVVLLGILGVLTFFFIQKRKKDREAEEHNQQVAARQGGGDERDHDQQIEARLQFRSKLGGRWTLDRGSITSGNPPTELTLETDGTVRAVLTDGNLLGSLELSQVNSGGDSAEVILRLTGGTAATFGGPMTLQLSNGNGKLTFESKDKSMVGAYIRAKLHPS